MLWILVLFSVVLSVRVLVSLKTQEASLQQLISNSVSGPSYLETSAEDPFTFAPAGIVQGYLDLEVPAEHNFTLLMQRASYQTAMSTGISEQLPGVEQQTRILSLKV